VYGRIIYHLPTVLIKKKNNLNKINTAALLLVKKTKTDMFRFFLNNVRLIYFDLALRAANFSLKNSIADPKTQYGIAKVNKNIINQNPKVKIDKKAKNPKYWSKSNILFTLFTLQI
jgi:hypothetical protein